jgi:hypothetical protein
MRWVTRTRRLLSANIEATFGVRVPNDLARLTTVRDVLQCVASLGEARRARP